MKVPEVGGLRRLMLVTGDAEELYQRYAGFTECGKGGSSSEARARK